MHTRGFTLIELLVVIAILMALLSPAPGSTNASLPLNQWMPIATNTLNANGNFSIIATNAVLENFPQQFFILQTQ